MRRGRISLTTECTLEWLLGSTNTKAVAKVLIAEILTVTYLQSIF
jgi:hypothetical protein